MMQCTMGLLGLYANENHYQEGTRPGAGPPGKGRAGSETSLVSPLFIKNLYRTLIVQYVSSVILSPEPVRVLTYDR